jgi:hypothetical protein
MNDDQISPGPPDPWAERLIALLYDELSPGEAQAVRREIDANADLRRSWEEVQTAREALGALAHEELGAAPAWVSAGVRVSDRRGRGFPSRRSRPAARPRDRVRDLVSGSAWGLAAAALLLLTLGLARFRVERVENGLTFYAGTGPLKSTATPEAAPGRDAGPAAPAFTAVRSIPSDELPYVTRDELRAYAAELSRRMAVLLDDRARRRDAATTAWLQVAFEEMSRRQACDYGDLRYRLEQVGIGLAQGQSRANEQIDWLLRLDRREQDLPALVPVTEEGDTP